MINFRRFLNKVVMIDEDVKELQKWFYQTGQLKEGKINSILVLGIGNYLMGDEGVGVHAIHALSKTRLPQTVDIVDGGTGSFDLMPLIAKYPVAVFIDAAMDGKPAGTIDMLYPKFAADFPAVLSAHDVGLKDMIDALEFKGELPKIILITVTIDKITPMTIKLSEPVQNALPGVVEKVKELTGKIILPGTI